MKDVHREFFGLGEVAYLNSLKKDTNKELLKKTPYLCLII